MRKFLLTLSLLLLFTVGIFAESPIHGKVKDKKTGEVISFATITITKTGSKTPIKNTFTNDKGEFDIQNLPDGQYDVQITFVGYETITRKINIKDNKNINLGTIALVEDSHTLGEVTVTGQRAAVRLEVDRKTFDVSQDITNAGGSAADALENIPSVEVDQDGNVSLRGNSSVEVWINGRQSGLTSDNRGDILKQLPAESIDRIEVIDNPSAKFSAEGSAGIINIVLKKERKAGYYGSVSAGANTRGGANSSVNFNYNSSLLDAFATVGYRHMQSAGRQESEQINFGNALSSDYLESLDQYSNYRTRTKNNGNNLFTRFGFTLHATDKDDFGFASNIMFGKHKGHSLTPYHYGYIGLPNDSRTLYRQNNSEGDMKMQYYELNYRHNFSPTHFIDVVANRSLWNGDMHGYYRDSTVYNAVDFSQLYGDAMTTYRYEHQPLLMNNKSWEFKLDYENQITAALKLQAGYQANLSKENTPTESWAADNWQGDGAQINADYYNRFIYKMDTHAAYINAAWTMTKRFSLMAGLRGEYWKVNTESYAYDKLNNHESATPSSTFKKDFFELFPSVFLAYKLSETEQLQLNYTRRLRRPHGGELNSFMNTSDASLVHYGNPQLTPEFSNSFALNYLKQWTAHSVLLSAYYRPTTDVMSHVSYQGKDGRIYQTTMNVAKHQSTGFEATVKNTFFRILNLTTSVNLYYKKVDGFNYTGKDPLDPTNIINVKDNGDDNFTWNARMQAAIVLPWDISLQISGRYRSKEIESQGYRNANFTMETGLRKSFFNRQLILAINCRDLLNSRKRESFTDTQTFTRHQLHKWNGRNVNFVLTYTFGNSKPKKMQRPDDSQEYEEDNSGGTFGGY